MTFRDYLASFSATWKALTAAALLATALLKFTPLVPPWPDEGGGSATCLAVVACVIGFSLAFLCVHMSARDRRRLGIVAVLVSAAMSLLYVHLLATRVESLYQVIEGVEVTRRAVIGTELRNPEDVTHTPRELLELYGLDGGAWTTSSLASARVELLSAYMGFYLALTFGIGLTQGRGRS